MNLESIFTAKGSKGQIIDVQVDDNANLHVNGEKVVVEKKVSFKCYERILATLTTFAIVVQAIIGFLNYNNIQKQPPKVQTPTMSSNLK
ncbi:hypothetical protein [Candidatus Berkiella aquae]|uniref:Uncharacterized protein n=1 Tax=Candidatus Berkiella aquae TaxID=295108 RepID=A0A0Q9Z288_9GAMM|nr:hypothetical protein [Candidatus Berkiella aquae]MCS5711958.1 hypothetical protein [Candidatus Berkiella aquae]